MNKQRTLTIRFDDMGADGRDFVAAWSALDSGAEVPATERALTFESLSGFLACLTEKRWTLLHALRRRGPCSIRRLAVELQRDYKNVYADVQRLRGLDLVVRNEEGLVYVPWDEIDARIALAA